MAFKFSLVVPTYNEVENIEELCRQLIGVLNPLQLEFEIIIVDDDSPDGTWRIAQNLAKEDPRIKVIYRVSEKGLATAVISGWAKADGEVLGVIDADLQHPPEVLRTMLSRIVSDNDIDIVVASRYIEGGGVSNWSFLRIYVSRLATFLSSIFIPRAFKKVKDPMSGCFILKRNVIKDTILNPIGYKILLEVLVKGDYKKIVEVPYIFKERKKGGSKAGIKQYIISLVHFIRLGREFRRKCKT